jgi:Fur family ferric uptake transcriptional regulator
MDTGFEEVVATRLRRVGQRLTPRRRRLLDVLARAGQPLTITEILGRDGTLATSSSYRNLVVLEQAGVVQRIPSGEGFARFELREELTQHHHHLVCSSCGSVEDLDAEPAIEEAVSALTSRLRGERFLASGHRLDVFGLCSNCR